MRQQVQVMLDLQNDMNTKVNADWTGKNFEWYRAIWIECAEMLDHYGWKWWKKQEPDIEQVKLELIDIWHFGLSILLLEKRGADEVAQAINAASKECDEMRSFALELEDFVASTLSRRHFDLPRFIRLMAAIDLSFNELFSAYVGKNVLNFFRQDHGYQQGHYRKIWAGREDNEHLVELCGSLNAGSPTFREDLYRELESRYRVTAETEG